MGAAEQFSFYLNEPHILYQEKLIDPCMITRRKPGNSGKNIPVEQGGFYP